VGGDKKYIFEVDTLKDKEVIEKASKHETIWFVGGGVAPEY
jgi:hypothetical protein